MGNIKGAAIPASGKKIASNPTGQLGHPGNPKVVKNDPTLNLSAGADGFSGNQSKPKASIK